MKQLLQLLEVVALAVDRPDDGIVRGQVGTLVEALTDGWWEVEFSDDDGKTYALLALPAEQLITLHHAPVRVG